MNDVAVLEFDFVAATELLTFSFLSLGGFKETINDVFAFFVSGPGIRSVFGNSTNVAFVPDSDPAPSRELSEHGNKCEFFAGYNELVCHGVTALIRLCS